MQFQPKSQWNFENLRKKCSKEHLVEKMCKKVKQF